MTTLAMSVEVLTSRWLPLAADVVLKGAAVLILAAVAVRLMRRHSAATRHALWLLALVGLAGLPLLTAALPAWPVLPEGLLPESTLAEPAAPETVATITALRPVAAADDSSAILSPTLAGLAASTTRGETAASPAAPVPATRSQWSVATWLAMVWTAGVAVCLARLGLAAWSLRRLARRCRPVTDAESLQLVERVSRQLGLSRPVRLVESDRRTMPMIWGLCDLTLLVPTEARSWSSDRRRAVLLHELAHARRRDCLTKLIGQAACALHWFNPLAWWAMKRMELEAESACDDLVLEAGHRPSDYAVHVLELATGLESCLLAVPGSIAMAGPGDVEGRVRGILDVTRNRRVLTTLALALVAVVVAVVVVVISSMHSALPDEAVPPAAPASPEIVAATTGEPAADVLVDPVEPAKDEVPVETPAEPANPAVVAPAGPAVVVPAVVPAEPEKPPMSRQEWIARLAALGDTATHESGFSTGTTEAVWRVGLSDDQARKILAIEDEFAPVFKETGDQHHAVQIPLLMKSQTYLAEEMEAQKAGKKLDWSEEKMAEAKAASQAYRDSRTAMWKAYGDLERQWYNSVSRVLSPQQLQSVPQPRPMAP